MGLAINAAGGIRLGDRRVRFITTGWDASYGPAAGETELFESSDRSDRYGRSWRKAAVLVRSDLGHPFPSLAGQRSRRQFRTRVSSDHLWRLSKGAQEGAAHAVAIGETRLPGDDVDRMAALLHHQASGLDAQVLDRLGR